MYNKIRKSKKVLSNATIVIAKKTWIRPTRIVPTIKTIDELELDLALARYGISR